MANAPDLAWYHTGMAECPICGITFERLSGGQKYCSRACSLAKRHTKQVRVCIVCYSEFYSTGNGTRFCSTACREQFAFLKSQQIKNDLSRVCKFCGKNFVASNAKQIYCSKACCQASHKCVCICIICGKEFINLPNVKTCSKACRIIYQKSITKTASTNIHICEQCGKEFYHTHDNRKVLRFCCVQCRTNHNLQHAQIHQRLTMICENCGIKFEYPAAQHNRMYYSRECSMAHYSATREHPIKEAICVECGKIFIAHWKSSVDAYNILCSATCRDAYNGRRLGRFPDKIANHHITDIERITKDELIRRDIAFAFEVSIGVYWLDFLLPSKIVIECDGVMCNGNLHIHCEHMRYRDEYKDKFLTEQGYTVYRWTGQQIKTSIKNLVEKIVAEHPNILTPTQDELDYLIANDQYDDKLTKLSSGIWRTNKEEQLFIRSITDVERTQLIEYSQLPHPYIAKRAKIILASADGLSVTQIKKDLSATEARDTIRKFNQIGMECMHNSSKGREKW